MTLDVRPQRHRLRIALVGVVAAAILVGAGVGSATAGLADTAADSREALVAVVAPLSQVTPWVIACLLTISVAHYVAAAVTARAAAGTTLNKGELLSAQLAAAAANRLTPAGLGGAALLARFFARRGQLSPVQAAAAVSGMSALGALADLVAFAALIGAGTLLDLPGVAAEAPALAARVTGLVSFSGRAVAWLAVGLLVAIAVTTLALRRRAIPALRRVASGLREFSDQLAGLMRRPARLGTLLAASSTTTLLLAAGFAAAATVPSYGLPPSHFAALMVGYMVAAAAANALPTPGGIGTADAAFVGVLVEGQMAAGPALATVLVFRLITFWLPAVAGLFTGRALRRSGAL